MIHKYRLRTDHSVVVIAARWPGGGRDELDALWPRLGVKALGLFTVNENATLTIYGLCASAVVHPGDWIIPGFHANFTVFEGLAFLSKFELVPEEYYPQEKIPAGHPFLVQPAQSWCRRLCKRISL